MPHPGWKVKVRLGPPSLLTRYTAQPREGLALNLLRHARLHDEVFVATLGRQSANRPIGQLPVVQHTLKDVFVILSISTYKIALTWPSGQCG